MDRISIRAPARGATQYQGGANAWIEFQSALPRGERPDISSEIHKAFLISIRAPARGATLLHAGTAYQWCISIRAPARGATITSNRSVRLIRISIRAPARGATQFRRSLTGNTRFQSALPRGERHSCKRVSHADRHISIRAPARGATTQGNGGVSVGKNFNPRSREGSDRKRRHWRKYTSNFNPRSREGSDGFFSSSTVPSCNFNPRSREGSDNNFHQKVLFSLSKNCLIHLFFITNFLN